MELLSLLLTFTMLVMQAVLYRRAVQVRRELDATTDERNKLAEHIVARELPEAKQ